MSVHCADGYHGLTAEAPFDGILITAAISEIPAPLTEQLREGGRFVLPLNSSAGFQNLVVVEKLTDGELDIRQVLPVAFVPFTRAH